MASCDICVNLSDIITPQSFSSLVTTLIKYLIYEKQLIPYPYDRLKLYIKKYKELNIEVSLLFTLKTLIGMIKYTVLISYLSMTSQNQKFFLFLFMIFSPGKDIYMF